MVHFKFQGEAEKFQQESGLKNDRLEIIYLFKELMKL